MKVMKKIITLLALVSLFSACKSMFMPEPEDTQDLAGMISNAERAQGLLGNAYVNVNTLLPAGSLTDVATDDAVTNDLGDVYRLMANGGYWTASNSPANSIDRWATCLRVVQYLNLFLANADAVTWAHDEPVQKLYVSRMSGEAYGMRALYWYLLLQSHGGKVADGTLLGIPIFKEGLEISSVDFNLPRNTYQECVDAILEDLNKAIELLPAEYEDLSSLDQIPAIYKDYGFKTFESFNRAAGSNFKGRMNGRIAEAIRAQVALMAASPAYSEQTTTTWEDAANFAAAAIKTNGGLQGLSATGGTWYLNHEEITEGSYEAPKELLWTDKAARSSDMEENNFPSSLNSGDVAGRINPTQNLVDAFPMANGYPITAANSGYDPNAMYENRDPRLEQYILYNGATFKDKEIVTGTYVEGNDDGLNADPRVSTRTGYYMRKLLNPKVTILSNGVTSAVHFPAHIRYTEMYLIYAEAANEAWGPKSGGSNGYSAYDVIKAIRTRAGIDSNDRYLEEAANSKETMRELIRNERRIELCFENKRFWDLRRWNLSLNEAVRGVTVTQSANGELIYTTGNVTGEARGYSDYMYYGPIPHTEVMRYSNLQQNQGWN
jgi:hypothetical protein